MFNHDHSHANDSPSDDPLNWMAVQYVLGELPEADAAAFEERLATDLVACEAVSQATRLTMTLQVAAAELQQAVVPTGRPVRHPQHRSWVALAGVASVAASLLAALWLIPAGPVETQLARHDRSASELVSLWRMSSAAAAAEVPEADVELIESGSEVAVPNWLLAAVSLEQTKPLGTASEERQEN